MSVNDRMAREIAGWIESRHQDRFEEIARQHDDSRTGTETIEVSLEELDDVDDDVPFARAMSATDKDVFLSSTEAAVRRAFVSIAHEMDEIDDVEDLDTPDLELIDPIDEMYIDVSSPTSGEIGTMVAIRGRIRQSTDALTWASERVYRCTRCLTKIDGSISANPRHVVEGVEREPTECITETCPGTEWEMVVSDSEFRDYRHVIVEQQPGDGGTTPSKIPCWVFGAGRVSREYPEGERVTVVGVLRADTSGEQPEQYIDVHSISTDEDRESVELTDDDRERVKEMVGGMDDAWETAAENLAPDIYGADLAKRGLVTSMVSAGLEERGENNHVLLIGDPGTGKTALAESVREILPSSRKASMTHSSEVGLTAAAVRESVAVGGEKWVIRAGALSLASGGVLTAEELDKANFDLSSLNDALESGEVSVDKAGERATVQTDSRLIATANPEDAQFDPREELDGQIGFSADVIDRFSLIYPFRDEKDNKQRNEGIRDSIASRYLDDSEMEGYDDYTRDIDIEDMRKWFAMAREQEVTMTEEAADEIGSAWLRIREDSGGVIDIDVRRYESMMRMALALARLRFGDEVTVEDASKAARHVSGMLGEWGYEITGEAPTASSPSDDDDGGDGDSGRSLTDFERESVTGMASDTDYSPEEIAGIKGIEDAMSDVREVVSEARSGGQDNEESDTEDVSEDGVGDYMARTGGDD